MTKDEALRELDRIEAAYQCRQAVTEKAKPYMLQMEELLDGPPVRQFWVGARAYSALADEARMVAQSLGERQAQPGDALQFFGIKVRLGPQSVGLDAVVAK